MKIRTRIATAVTVALASVFVAAPAFAHNGEDHAKSIFDHSGGHVNVAAILITGAILLAIVLFLSVAIGNLFEKK